MGRRTSRFLLSRTCALPWALCSQNVQAQSVYPPGLKSEGRAERTGSSVKSGVTVSLTSSVNPGMSLTLDSFCDLL